MPDRVAVRLTLRARSESGVSAITCSLEISLWPSSEGGNVDDGERIGGSTQPCASRHTGALAGAGPAAGSSAPEVIDFGILVVQQISRRTFKQTAARPGFPRRGFRLDGAGCLGNGALGAGVVSQRQHDGDRRRASAGQAQALTRRQGCGWRVSAAHASPATSAAATSRTQAGLLIALDRRRRPLVALLVEQRRRPTVGLEIAW